MNVPKLRFKEFNDEWSLTNIRNISSLVTKGTTPRKYEDKGINFVKVENIHDNTISNISSYISEDTHNKELKRSILKENDILFSIAGALGRTAIVKNNNLPANTNQANAIIRIDNLDNMDLYYLLNRLNHSDITNYINKCQSVGAQPNLSLEQVNNINVSLPSKKEQIKIGKLLELLDRKIELQSKKIEDLKLFKLCIKKKLFSKLNKYALIQIEKLLNFEQPSKYIVESEEYINDCCAIPVLTANKAFILGYCKEDKFYNKGNCIIFDDFTMDMKYVTFPFKIKSSAIKILTSKENVDLKYIYEYLTYLNLHSEEHKRHYISMVQKIYIPNPEYNVQMSNEKRDTVTYEEFTI